MPDYLRNRIPGASYFFTVNLLDRRCDLLVAHIDALPDAVCKARRRSPFHIDEPVDWPFSNFRRCLVSGLYSADCLGGGPEPAEMGERP
jgi:hypothetical protein